MLYKYPYQSELGTITLLANDYGLLGAWFENREDFGGTFDLGKVEQIKNREESVVIAKAAKWLDDYFGGQTPREIAFQLIPQGTAPQQDVWIEMQKISYGHTITLDELADRVAERQTKGNGSINAIVGAIKTNPIDILLPSHRIIESKSDFFCYIGPTNRKIKLLKIEGYI